jgi:alanine racemase
MTGTPLAVATISRTALRRNVRLLRERVGPAALMAIVKDDAYGHGLDDAVDTFSGAGVDRFGALDLDTALSVRRARPDATIFAWVFARGDDLGEAARARIDLGVTDAATLERVASMRDAGAPPRVHLKLDSGLHRAGVLPHEWSAFVERAARLQTEGRIAVAGLWTHIAEASDDDDTAAIRRFESAVETARGAGLRPQVLHLAASAAAYTRADARFDMVRVGAFLYGIAPGGGVGPADLGLAPAMTLTAPVVDVVEQDGRRSARIAVGGLDGLLSDAAGGAPVMLGGERATISAVEAGSSLVVVGKGRVEVGDTATLFGDPASGAPTLQEWGDTMGTIGEEIVTRLSERVTRVWID